MRSLCLLFVPFTALALVPVACGGSVDTSTTQGAGGASSSTTGGDASVSSSTSGAGGSSACSGYLDVTEMGGKPQHFASICEGSWGANETTTALGYRFSGGIAPGVDAIEIKGCAGAGSKSAGIDLSTPNVTAPGTYTSGSMTYTSSNGLTSSTFVDEYKVVITRLDEPGGVIEGTFTGSVSGPADGTIALAGSFHVCRVADQLVP